MEEQNLSFSTPQGNFTYRVAALIIKDDKLLMAKHQEHPCYYTVGGRVMINETSEEAVTREVFEEISVKLKIERLAFVQERFKEISGQKHHEIVFFYLMQDTSKINIADNSFTDQGAKETLHWLPIEDLDKNTIAPENLKDMLLSMDNKPNIQHIVSIVR